MNGHEARMIGWVDEWMSGQTEMPESRTKDEHEDEDEAGRKRSPPSHLRQELRRAGTLAQWLPRRATRWICDVRLRRVLIRPHPGPRRCWFLHASSEEGRYEKVMSISLSPITIFSTRLSAILRLSSIGMEGQRE